MISRRDKLLNYPFELQRFAEHKHKIRTAKPAIDVSTPPIYPHIIVKSKKVQKEMERLQRIEVENVRLLQKLGSIMHTKRLENFWIAPRPNFLGREKMFETRAQSSLPRLISPYEPSSYRQSSANETNRSEDSQIKSPFLPKAPNAKTALRCGACRPPDGVHERYLVQIPEARIPWQLPRKSWNVKTHEFCGKKCLHLSNLISSSIDN